MIGHVGPTRLMRCVLTIDNMCAPDCIVWVREKLVARGAVGEAEVAPAHVKGPDQKAIQAALETGSYQLVSAVTKVGQQRAEWAPSPLVNQATVVLTTWLRASGSPCWVSCCT
jgi:hypothetical protein